ncbi:carbamoyltransferase HypF [Methanoregula sp. UBA64]|jgi:hydrogenase maturation protein HypF|uniref:carbamoyltransferase HypF n=1 Tax=Methanoregula sp. UBA64 TaxID=1915554 RepID=UPI0025CD8C69|nr:carbamoyltransferase HypF [Methanoregula sp. UBA64]
MQKRGKISVRGIVQGVGFRPFVYAKAIELGICGRVKNLGSEVEILAAGDRFDEFVASVSRGPPMARIDSVQVTDFSGTIPEGFSIEKSATGSFSGMIPPDIAICAACVKDIFSPKGRYEGYWATSCVNCGPRYSIINAIPYDRERTSMDAFPMCGPCAGEYGDPHSRRHHAQTIACHTCGPQLRLLDRAGADLPCKDPVREAAALLDKGSILAIRGVGGFHLACTEESSGELKKRLGRVEQPFAVMTRPGYADEIAVVSPAGRELLESPVHPIVVLEKKNPASHAGISNLHTIGCMLPYTGLHHLLFSHLSHPLLIMTSANMPGYPMITDTETALEKLAKDADYFLVHNRAIANRVDDSVVRDGYILRLSRGIAPKRTAIDLGNNCILGVGPELNANATIYKGGFAVTSPHVGNVRNPATLAYLQETIEKLTRLLGAEYDIVAHDLHPQFLSTRYAREIAEEKGIGLVPVQHHRAHIAATTTDPCVGIAIDGVGYGDDGTVWGGEVFAGQVPDLARVGHLEPVPMPGGDLATKFPERMLYGILPDDACRDLLSSRGWTGIELGVIQKQVATGFNVTMTSSTGRVLDAAAALLGICRERTYDGEPAMKLESAAAGATPEVWEPVITTSGGCEVLSTRALLATALSRYTAALAGDRAAVSTIAASVQYNLARGIAALAIRAAEREGIPTVALSGGVVANRAIRETIRSEVRGAGLSFLINDAYPPGDGCVSFGQCVWAGMLSLKRD